MFKTTFVTLPAFLLKVNPCKPVTILVAYTDEYQVLYYSAAPGDRENIIWCDVLNQMVKGLIAVQERFALIAKADYSLS